MTVYTLLICSTLLNIGLLWYAYRLLRKFLYISENLSDFYLTVRAFKIFASSMYSMDTYYGEPMIQELVARIREVTEEVERFRDVFEPTLDDIIEEELDAAEEAAEEEGTSET